MLPRFSEGTPLALASTILASAWLYILTTPVASIEATAITLSLGTFVAGLVTHYWLDFSVGWAGTSALLLGTITLFFPFTNPPIMNMPADLMAVHYFFIFGAYFASYLAVHSVKVFYFGEE